MPREKISVRIGLLLAFLVLSIGFTGAAISQTVSGFSLVVNIGEPTDSGECREVDEIEYRIDELTFICLEVKYNSQAPVRFELSGHTPGNKMEMWFSIVVLSSPLSDDISYHWSTLQPPSGTSYGIHDLEVSLGSWEVLDETSMDAPGLEANMPSIIYPDPESSVTANFLLSPVHKGAFSNSISKLGLMEGSLDFSNHGESASFTPALFLDGDLIAEGDDFTAMSGGIESISLGFELPFDIQEGATGLAVGVLSSGGNSVPIWQSDLPLEILPIDSQVSIEDAQWGVSSLRGSELLSGLVDDVVEISASLANHGGLAATIPLALHWSLDGWGSCQSEIFGEINLESARRLEHTLNFTLPHPGFFPGMLDSRLSTELDCNIDDGSIELERLQIQDWPIQIVPKLPSDMSELTMDGSSPLSIPLILNNPSLRPTGEFLVEVELIAEGEFVLGSGSSVASVGANSSIEFPIEISSGFCFEGLLDLRIRIVKSGHVVIENSMPRSISATWVKVLDGYSVDPELVGRDSFMMGDVMELGFWISIQEEGSPSCTALLPVVVELRNENASLPSMVLNQLVEVQPGVPTRESFDVPISSFSGSYSASIAIANTAGNKSGPGFYWLDRESDYDYFTVMPRSPDVMVQCSSTGWSIIGKMGSTFDCRAENEMAARVWVKVWTEIDGLLESEVPFELMGNDAVSFGFKRHFDSGDDRVGVRVWIEVLWDGLWEHVPDSEIVLQMDRTHPLETANPLPYDYATTHPTLPRPGSEFTVNFRARGSTLWENGSLSVKLLEGGLWHSFELEHDLEIGQEEAVAVRFDSWPSECGSIPYSIEAIDSLGKVVDTIVGEFRGCHLEYPDLNVTKMDVECEIQGGHDVCKTAFTVANTGKRDFEAGTDGASIWTSIDGELFDSGLTIGDLGVGGDLDFRIPIAKSSFREVTILIDPENKHSEPRENNGKGWSSKIGTISFENDTDFDGLTDLFEEGGYWVQTIEDRESLQTLLHYLDDPEHNSYPDMEERLCKPDPTDHDSDNDGLSDGLEYRIGTDANNPDSDSDGYDDYEEYLSDDQDPLIVEHSAPEIEAFEPSEHNIPSESDGTLSLFGTKLHSRTFEVTERNLRFVEVWMNIEDEEPELLHVTFVHSESDVSTYSVTYEYPGWLEEFNVTAIAHDHHGNIRTFVISEQNSAWDRVTTSLNYVFTDSIVSILAAPVAGFVVGAIYVLKDIVDFVRGLWSFVFDGLLDNLWGVLQVLIDCSIPGYDKCPINLHMLVELGMGIPRSLWNQFAELSPFGSGVDHITFVSTAIATYLVVSTMVGGAIWKTMSKTLGMIRSLKAVDALAIGFGSTVSAIASNFNKAISTFIPGSIRGIPLKVKNAMQEVSPTLDTFLSVKEVTGVVVAVSNPRFIRHMGKLTKTEMDDVLKYYSKGKKKNGNSGKLLEPAALKKIKTHKTRIVKEIGEENWDQWLDDFATYQVSKNSRAAAAGIFREKWLLLKDGDSFSLTVNCAKNAGALCKSRQFDKMKVEPGNPIVVKSIESKHTRNHVKELPEDWGKPKRDPRTRGTHDRQSIEEFCSGVSLSKCKEKFQQQGLDQDQADLMASCSKGVEPCVFEIEYDVSYAKDMVKPCNTNAQCSSGFDIESEDWGKFSQAYDGAYDSLDGSAFYDAIEEGGVSAMAMTLYSDPGQSRSSELIAFGLLISLIALAFIPRKKKFG